MIIKEYRVTLPMTVEEYQVAQLYSVAEASKNETGGGEGVQVLKNEPYEDVPLLNGKFTKGQYTYKIYHLASKVPGWIKMIAPKGSLELHEEAWNAYPYCRTVLTNPGYMKDNFYIIVETYHLPDRGDTENAHELDKDKLKKRIVVPMDIATDDVLAADFKKDEDPSTYKSEKTGRGPLQPGWKEKECYDRGNRTKDLDTSKVVVDKDLDGFEVITNDNASGSSVEPIMTAYKLVTIQFKWWGLQDRVENFIHTTERRIFLNFHRQVFCWTDKWHGMTMEDIRALEDKTKKELDIERSQGTIKGTVAVEK